MTNNLDEFEQPDLEHGNGQPQQPSGGIRGNLTNAWRTRPLFKLLVIMVVAAAVIAIGLSLFSSPKPTEITKLAAPPTGLKQAPGGSSTPYFVEQTKKAEAERQNTALRTGGDALPTPIGANTSIDEMTAEKQKKDPLIELRAQIEQQKQKIQQIEQQKQPAQQQKEQFDDSLAQAMQKQLQQLQSSWEPKGIKEVSGKGDDKDHSKNQNGQGGANGSGYANASDDMSDMNSSTKSKKRFGTPVISAGTVSYAQLLTEANSDAPGPILAQILSGPLNGARAVGDFKVEHDYLVLKFGLANLKGIDYRISAYALDPDTTLPALATEVDQRYFTRVLLPAAAGFMQGFGSALGQNSSSVVTNGQTTIVQQSGKGLQQGLFTGLGQAGTTLGQFFQNQANETKPLVRVAAGTPMGLFFTQSVCDGTGCPLNDLVEDRARQQAPSGGSQPGCVNCNVPGMQGQGAYGAYNGAYNGGTYNMNIPGGGYAGSQTNAYVPPQGYNGADTAQNNNAAGTNPYPNPSSPYNNNSSSPLGYQSNGYNALSAPGIGTPIINP